jgi:hypothetical protein
LVRSRCRHEGEWSHELRFQKEWRWSGTHYQRTALEWLGGFDSHRDEIENILRKVYGTRHRRTVRLRRRQRMGRQPSPDEGGGGIDRLLTRQARERSAGSLFLNKSFQTDREWNHDRVRWRKFMLFQSDIPAVTLSRRKAYCIAADVI